MKTGHIDFEVIIADSFTYPEKNNTNNLHLWPVPEGKSEELIISIEVEWDEGGDVLREAEMALDKHIKENYPKKTYKIYYWWWKEKTP